MSKWLEPARFTVPANVGYDIRQGRVISAMLTAWKKTDELAFLNDVNAAVNVAKAAGLAVSACGARVRPGLVPAQREETATHPKPQPVTTGRQAGISVL